MPDKPVRILHIASLDNGGIQAWYMSIYRNLDKTKFQFDFLTTKEGNGYYGAEIKAMGGNIYCIPLKNRSFISMLSWINKAYNFFRNHPEYKIVHCHISDPFASTKAIPARLAGVESVIVHSRSSTPQKAVKQRFVRQLTPFIGTDFWAISKISADTIFPPSITVQGKYIITGSLREIDIFRYNNNTRKKVRQRLELESSFVIGSVARFVEPKNHVFLLDVFHLICQASDTAKLLLIGWGPLEGEVKEKAKNLGITDRILFLGEIPQNEVHEYYQAMDVFVLPSLREGLPGVIIEAQASGLPCIVSDTVTNECKFTDLVSFCPLEVQRWCPEIISSKNTPRRDTYDEMANLSVNVKAYVKVMESAYADILQRNMKSK